MSAVSALPVVPQSIPRNNLKTSNNLAIWLSKSTSKRQLINPLSIRFISHLIEDAVIKGECNQSVLDLSFAEKCKPTFYDKVIIGR